MNNTLESYKVFPYIAWALVIGFALFTYSLTLRLEQDLIALDDLGPRVDQLEARIDAMEASRGQ
jgi:hypothetical protein